MSTPRRPIVRTSKGGASKGGASEGGAPEGGAPEGTVMRGSSRCGSHWAAVPLDGGDADDPAHHAAMVGRDAATRRGFRGGESGGDQRSDDLGRCCCAARRRVIEACNRALNAVSIVCPDVLSKFHVNW